MDTTHNQTPTPLTRRRFLRAISATGAVALLAACGAAPQAAAPSAPSVQPQATSAPAPTAAVQPTGAANATTAGFPRTIRDANGSVVIEAQPKRIVALNQIALQYLAPFIGQVELVGYAKREGMAPELVAALEGVPSFDSENVGANIELIVKWQPDLAFESDAGDYFDAVAKAVKVVNLPVIRPGSWRDSTRMIGQALGLEDDAEKHVAETDAMIKAEARPNRGTLAIAYMYKPGIVTFETNGTALGGLLAELGFALVSPKDPASPWEEVSVEVAAERLNVDHLFISNYGKESVDGIIAQPVLAAVPVIAEKRYTVPAREVADAATFFGPASAKFVLEALRVLPGGTAATAPAAVPAAASYPRTVTDAAGVAVSIPARPQRVVCLQNLWDLDAVLSLGIAPVQFGIRSFLSEYTGSPQVSWKWHEETVKKLGGDAKRVNGDEPNIETVVAAKPDLIVGMAWSLEKTRDQLATLAPVIQVVANWRESLKIVGEAFAMPEQAAKIIADTDRRIATSLSDLNMGKKSVAIISCYDNTYFNGFGHPADGRADLFQRAGFTLLDVISTKATADTPVYEFSIELLPSLAPADVVVLFDYGSDGTNASGILENPLFKTLPAVQAGRLVVLKQGELAQGLSTISPINIEFCLNVVRQAGKLVA